jgi:SPP1 family predicted phage head-tail adaptor
MIPKTQIRIEKWAANKDANGNMIEGIEQSYNLWAELIQQGNSRTDTAGQVRLSNGKQFKIRFRPDWKVTSKWKFVYLQKRYTITGIERVNEKRFNWIINGEG